MHMRLTTAGILSATFALLFAAPAAWAQDAETADRRLREPVFRVSKNETQTVARKSEHPLDPHLADARERLEYVKNHVNDYTATIIKRERVDGELGEHQYMFAKVRNRKVRNGRLAQPFSVYLYFLKPEDIKGREVLYVEGQNGGKMIAHEGGTLGRFAPSVWLNPEGTVAMRDQNHPITHLGLVHLLEELVGRGENDRKHGEIDVKVHKNAKINGRSCTMLQITHPVQRPYFDFHMARIFIDDELNVPIRYAAYGWPSQPGGKPPVLEEYTYVNLKLNPGLTDDDFDHNNPSYNFH